MIQFYPSKGKLNPIKKFTISFMANKFIQLCKGLKPIKNKKNSVRKKKKLFWHTVLNVLSRFLVVNRRLSYSTLITL